MQQRTGVSALIGIKICIDKNRKRSKKTEHFYYYYAVLLQVT